MDSFRNDSQELNFEKELKEYSKQLYISLWLIHAEEDEDEEEVDVKYERKAAIRQFEDFYNKV